MVQVTYPDLFADITSLRFGFAAAPSGQADNHIVHEDVSVTSLGPVRGGGP